MEFQAQKTVECIGRLENGAQQDPKIRESVRFKKICFFLILLPTSIFSQIQSFMIRSLHEEKKYYACGFFVVDNSIVFSVCSSIVTYLLILIQFKQLED